jgi:aerobic carbon-monoxide dehydrogenase small subunit
VTTETRIHEAGENQTIRLTVNGDSYELLVLSNDTLLNVLRNNLQLTGTKYGCGTGDCCACTVQVDGRSMLSCLSLASDLDGASVTTVEGLMNGRYLHPIQESFVEHGAVQCGFCTPGMIMSIKSLLEENPDPSETEIRHYLRGNLCRCTGYRKIVDAALSAAKKLNKARDQ